MEREAIKPGSERPGRGMRKAGVLHQTTEKDAAMSGPEMTGRLSKRRDRPKPDIGPRKSHQADAGPLLKMSDRADNSRSICPSVPTVIRR